METEALRRIAYCLNNNETHLELYDCELIDGDFEEGSPIDIALRKCTHLLSLSLGYTVISYSMMIPGPRDRVTGEYYGQNNANNFSRLPSAISALVNLQELLCAGKPRQELWGIRDFGLLAGLKQLRVLDISYNILGDLNGLPALPSLETLGIQNNDIGDLGGISKFPALLHLFAGENKIRDLRKIGQMASLKILDLSSNAISDLDGLALFPELETADLSHNKITVLKDPGDFPALQLLDLSYNLIDQVEPCSGSALRGKVRVGNNRIDEMTKSGYESYFSTNDLFSEDWLSKLKNEIVRKQIFEQAAALRDVEKKMQAGKALSDADRKDFDRIFLEQYLLPNPLAGLPMEVIRQGNEAIVHYLGESERTGTESLYEAKMLIVGQPRAGKTSLRYKLFDQDMPLPVEEQTTRGIDIQPLEFDISDERGKSRKFNYNVWDFGGQQIYQTTHQFFLTHRSLYVLVIDAAKDSIGNDDSSVNYWLQAIELLGGNSPMLLVKNIKADRQVNIDLSKKRARFLFLKDDFNIDLDALIRGTSRYDEEKSRDFRRLKATIENELRHLPLVGFRMPRNWVRIRLTLQELSLTKPYISKQEYLEICRNSGVVEYERQMELSGIFHDLGVFLHFQEHASLDEFIILQNVWATDAVFAVLDSASVQANNGMFANKDLDGIWQAKGYNKIVHKKLLALMMRFDLCYEINQGKQPLYIVPEMLSIKPPDEYSWPQENNLVLFYRYDFMPRGLLTRLIVRLNKYIHVAGKKQMVWKTGVQIDGDSLSCPNTLAEITEAWDNRQLFIRVRGNFPRDLMNKITVEIDVLNNDYFRRVDDVENKQKSKWYKMIPCNCGVCRNSEEKNFYDYGTLLRAMERDRPIQCQISFEDVRVQDLLDGVFKRDGNQSIAAGATSKPKKIFISYSKEDLRLVNKFIESLSALKLDGKVESWYCTELEAGVVWDRKIKEQFDQSDIVCFMVSPNFMRTSFIQEHEVKWAFERIARDPNFRIVPIILDFCRWETKENNLSQYAALPYTAKPVMDFKNQNLAWYIIEECLAIILNDDKAPGGSGFYRYSALPKRVLQSFERLMAGELDV